MKKHISTILAAGLIVAATTAGATVSSGEFSLSPVVGGYTFDGKQHTETKPVYGVRAGYTFTKNLGVEGLFDYVASRTTRGATDINLYRYGGELLYHFLPDNRLVPYLAAGYAGISREVAGTMLIPVGAFDYGLGVKYALCDGFALRGDVRHLVYRYGGTTYNNLEYTVGLHFPFGGLKPAVKPVEPVPVQESYQPKAAAAAPQVVVEQVPEQPPVAAPAPAPPAPPVDSDGDGVPDSLDKCPGTPAGVKVDKDGCPLDSDGDGVPDYLDKCPGTSKGKAVDRNGCPYPEIFQEAAQKAAASGAKELKIDLRIEFDSGKASIKPKYDGRLKQVGEAMVQYPAIKAVIEGHTDNVGKAAMNKKLSERRAAAVKQYLVKKFKLAPARIATVGYGPSQPIGDNKTAKGKAQNRRIEGVFSGLMQ